MVDVWDLSSSKLVGFRDFQCGELAPQLLWDFYRLKVGFQLWAIGVGNSFLKKDLGVFLNIFLRFCPKGE